MTARQSDTGRTTRRKLYALFHVKIDAQPIRLL